MRYIELLSPARNAECGIEAIRHGADAVYIGGPGFGARSAAGNSAEDIRRLAEYAHRFKARVYVTMNTIVYDTELNDVRRQAWSMHEAGADALIVQDMALLAMPGMPPIELHASTQMDNRTAEKAESLWQAGFRQAVLARELTLSQIAEIHKAVPQMPLEAFVHGAVCVSLSGRCYASQCLMGRSANRGECAQVCRLPFDLVDGSGSILARQKHLLSLCDMNRSKHLEAMMDAGVSSFKIEGRLKDVDYVKNITAHYRCLIDKIIQKRPDEYARTSEGTCRYTFIPAPEKSFNRGFTDYFLTGQPAKWNPDTPKSMGPVVGVLKEVRRDHITVAGTSVFAAGDGLCYLDREGTLQGFRVNRVDAAGRLYLRPMPGNLTAGVTLHRNHDQAFSTALAAESAERRIAIKVAYSRDEDGFSLDCGNVHLHFDHPHEPARAPQDENIVRQLSRMGDTVYSPQVEVRSGGDCFVPSSVLSAWRRRLVEALQDNAPTAEDTDTQCSKKPITIQEGHLYGFNVANLAAASCTKNEINAYELHPSPDTPLMTCRHCVRRAMGLCGKPIHQPWHLVLSDGRRLRLDFDCRNCLMRIYADC